MGVFIDLIQHQTPIFITMTGITGTYLHESNDNYEAWLTAMGMPEEQRTLMMASKPTMEMALNGDQVTANIKSGDQSISNVLTSGKESSATLPGGIEIKVVLTATENTLKGTFDIMGKKGEADCVFNAEGFTQTVTSEGVTCKRIYKRQ